MTSKCKVSYKIRIIIIYLMINKYGITKTLNTLDNIVCLSIS